MSDFPCDPLFEVCEDGAVSNIESGVDSPHSGVEYSAMYENQLTIEQYSILWGGATAGMLALSAYYYFEYNYQIWTDNKYPYRY